MHEYVALLYGGNKESIYNRAFISPPLALLCDFQGIPTSIAKEPYIFDIFQGGGGGSGSPVPPLDPHMC